MISLIIPVYNNIKSIFLVFESIVQNLSRDDELIIIDDFSTDGTWEALVRLKEKKYKFDFILDRNHKNLGISSTLNNGIKYATRKYIARHDGDDIILNDRFKYQLEILKNNNQIDLLSSSKLIIKNYNYQNKINSVYELVREIPKQLDRNSLALANLITHPSVICKANILKENIYDKKFNAEGEDYHLWLRLVKKNIKLFIDETPVIMYFENNYYSKIKKQLLGSMKVRLLSINLKYPIFCFYLIIGSILDFLRLIYRLIKHA